MIVFKKDCNFPYLYRINDLLKIKIKKNAILIFEPFEYHYECTPGFLKYFLDIGYNVDLIINNIGITSLSIFETNENIRIFTYHKIDEIKYYSEYFSKVFNFYNHILIETTEPKRLKIFKALNLINRSNSIFVFHHLDYAYLKPFISLKNNQIWSLGNFSLGLQVNPHFFGNLKLKNKNRITKFFITSTINRNYKLLLSAVEKIKNENLKFHINVVGKWMTFTENSISENLKDLFSFNFNISYSQLYKEVYESDYIIINLDPNNKKNEEFKANRTTGSVQLAYGFSKPVLINKDFASIYNFNNNNSFIYENTNFTQTMKDAIIKNKKYYKEMQKNMRILSREIYMKSLINVKKSLKES